jgi:hypothetical protein
MRTYNVTVGQKNADDVLFTQTAVAEKHTAINAPADDASI